MNFLDYDVGSAGAGNFVTVTLSGVESDVLLMTASDVSRYRAGQSVTYWGGRYNRSPVQIPIPRSGSWHVLVVPGLGGTVHASVRLGGQSRASGF
jgi:hypothetical protein